MFKQHKSLGIYFLGTYTVPIIKQFFIKRWKNSGRAFAEFLQMQIVVIWHKFAMLIKKPLKTAEIDSELKQYIYVMWKRGFLRKKSIYENI